MAKEDILLRRTSYYKRFETDTVAFEYLNGEVEILCVGMGELGEIMNRCMSRQRRLRTRSYSSREVVAWYSWTATSAFLSGRELR